MTEYRVIIHPDFTEQFAEFRRIAVTGDRSRGARAGRAGIRAMKALRDGQEADLAGERLGFSVKHYDLRDCAEIKVEVLEEYSPTGKRLPPSHRMIYREFEPIGDDPRPVRQIIAFEHRKDGLPFTVAAQRLGRLQGFAAPELADLANVAPATGRKKDPDRPVPPYRLPLPPDLVAAVSTAQRTLPQHGHIRSPAPGIRTADPPTRQRVRER